MQGAGNDYIYVNTLKHLKIYICTKLRQKEIITEEIIDKMATTITFTKMQGAGNDYIYVNTLKHLMS